MPLFCGNQEVAVGSTCPDGTAPVDRAAGPNDILLPITPGSDPNAGTGSTGTACEQPLFPDLVSSFGISDPEQTPTQAEIDKKPALLLEQCRKDCQEKTKKANEECRELHRKLAEELKKRGCPATIRSHRMKKCGGTAKRTTCKKRKTTRRKRRYCGC